MEDLYVLLGVSRTASQEEIKVAYRKKAKIYHPDLNPGDEDAAEHFKNINLAYEVLSDKERRRQYDRYGNAIFDSNSGASYSADFDDLFGSIFEDFFGGGFTSSSSAQGSRPAKGKDIEQLVSLEFSEAVFGVKKTITVRREEACASCGGTGAKEGTKPVTCPTCGGTGRVQNSSYSAFGNFTRMETCPTCHGTGEYIEEVCEACHGKGTETKTHTMEIEIPTGVDNDTVMKVSGEGHAGKNGGPNGDLYLRIYVKDHDFFKRDGYDIYYELPIRFTQAVLGDQIEVPTLRGLEEFDLPAGTQSGETFTLKGKGVQRPRSGKKGDIIFKVKVVIPSQINERQRDLLEEFDEIDGESTKKQDSLLDKVKEFFS